MEFGSNGNSCVSTSGLGLEGLQEDKSACRNVGCDGILCLKNFALLLAFFNLGNRALRSIHLIALLLVQSSALPQHERSCSSTQSAGKLLDDGKVPSYLRHTGSWLHRAAPQAF